MSAIVRHKVFGQGEVSRIDSNFIEIKFGNMVKKFQFPQAFGIFLETQDAELLRMVTEAKQVKTVDTITSRKASTTTPFQTRGSSKHTTKKYTNREEWSVSNSLVGDRAQTIAVSTEEEMFEIIGYIARPGRINSIEAEVPKDGMDIPLRRSRQSGVARATCPD